jgi:hypothetical protein
VADVQAHARAKGLEAVAGIEITAVLDGRDVHMLAYFIDVADAAFQRFLVSQRAARIARLEAIGARLTELACPSSSRRRWRWGGCSRASRWGGRRPRARSWRRGT